MYAGIMVSIREVMCEAGGLTQTIKLWLQHKKLIHLAHL